MSHSMGGVTEELSVGLRISLGLSLAEPVMVGSDRSVTDNVHHVDTERLVLNLLCLHHLGLADVLGPGGAGLGDQHLVGGDTVGGGHCEGRRGREAKLRVGLSLGCWGGQGGGDQETEAQIL